MEIDAEKIKAIFCCADMLEHVKIEDMDVRFDDQEDEDKAIIYFSRYNEFGIDLDKNSYIIIEYCPWCGKKMPESLREIWFEELESRGYGHPLLGRENIPPKYKNCEWWMND